MNRQKKMNAALRRFPREWMRTLVASQQFKKKNIRIDKNNEGSGKNFISIKKTNL